MEIWGKIWNLRHWPKITLFLWLVSHSSILTWDNLMKRGFVGPSLCILCREAEETMNHLLNTCPYTAQLWDQVAVIMRTSDRTRDCIRATITNWREQAFHSPLLNRIWQLLPGFILWQTWKERNRRIFRNSPLTWQQCWSLCYRNIIETLSPDGVSHGASWQGMEVGTEGRGTATQARHVQQAATPPAI
jgi:hypothetical protein